MLAIGDDALHRDVVEPEAVARDALVDDDVTDEPPAELLVAARAVAILARLDRRR